MSLESYEDKSLNALIDALLYSERHVSKKRENKYARNRKFRKKMYYDAEKEWHYGVYPESWMAFKNGSKKFPKKVYYGKRSKYLKRLSNKKVRMYKGDLDPKSNKFHRIFEFKWQLD